MTTTLRKLWRQERSTYNGWMNIPSAWAAEVMARAGWDSVTVDLQHGFTSLETTLTLLQAIELGGSVPLVRASGNDSYQIQRLLDAGARGIICPMINDAAECAQFVGACRYPPSGYRSVGATRAGLLHADYVNTANEQILTFAMVETAAGLANLQDILTVPGLDGVFVGPGDLGLSLRVAGSSQALNDAIGQIARAARQAGRFAGIWCPSAAVARQRRRQGYHMLTIGTDSQLLAAAVRDTLAQARLNEV